MFFLKNSFHLNYKIPFIKINTSNIGEKTFNTINHREINNLFEFNSDDTIALFMI